MLPHSFSITTMTNQLKPKKSSNVEKNTFSSSPTPPMRRQTKNSPVVPPRVTKTLSNNNTQGHPNGNLRTLEHSSTAPVISQCNLTGITLPSVAYDPFQAPVVPPRRIPSQNKFQGEIFNSSYEQWAIKLKTESDRGPEKLDEKMEKVIKCIQKKKRLTCFFWLIKY